MQVKESRKDFFLRLNIVIRMIISFHFISYLSSSFSNEIITDTLKDSMGQELVRIIEVKNCEFSLVYSPADNYTIDFKNITQPVISWRDNGGKIELIVNGLIIPIKDFPNWKAKQKVREIEKYLKESFAKCIRVQSETNCSVEEASLGKTVISTFQPILDRMKFVKFPIANVKERVLISDAEKKQIIGILDGMIRSAQDMKQQEAQLVLEQIKISLNHRYNPEAITIVVALSNPNDPLSIEGIALKPLPRPDQSIHIDLIAVSPTHLTDRSTDKETVQYRGVGSAIIKYLISKNAGRLFTLEPASNTAAKSFGKMGFKKNGDSKLMSMSPEESNAFLNAP